MKIIVLEATINLMVQLEMKTEVETIMETAELRETKEGIKYLVVK